MAYQSVPPFAPHPGKAPLKIAHVLPLLSPLSAKKAHPGRRRDGLFIHIMLFRLGHRFAVKAHGFLGQGPSTELFFHLAVKGLYLLSQVHHT